MNKKANVVIAGDGIFAGVSPEDAENCELSNCIVIQFFSKEAMSEAIQNGQCDFDFMRLEDSYLEA
jgi:hypothetical protein